MGLKGDLAELPLTDLVEMTSVGGKTGRLVLFDEEDAVAGVLMFRGGRLVAPLAASWPPRRRSTRCSGSSRAPSTSTPLRLTTTRSTWPRSRCSWRACAAGRGVPPAPRSRRRPSSATARGKRRALEARVLGYLGPGARPSATSWRASCGRRADEYDALQRSARLAARGVVRVELPADADRPSRRGGHLNLSLNVEAGPGSICYPAFDARRGVAPWTTSSTWFAVGRRAARAGR